MYLVIAPAHMYRKSKAVVCKQSTCQEHNLMQTCICKSALTYIRATHRANEFCQEKKRATIQTQDVLDALQDLCFEDYIPKLKNFLEGLCLVSIAGTDCPVMGGICRAFIRLLDNTRMQDDEWPGYAGACTPPAQSGHTTTTHMTPSYLHFAFINVCRSSCN